ncbi:hypothetical protein SEA_CRAFF_54 [Mycobacterium phage Craff]|uniref:Uncharacterized protein n=1 Tax=Mycobacterium phage Craff TaxID=2250375 RepID=A0A2Z5HB17_9CAUD|nr:hypothetical protein SEA_CRAFF_54 [Mycobacterium phage Craff]
MPEQPIESTEVLASDDVYRAALVALRMWREDGSDDRPAAPQ